MEGFVQCSSPANVVEPFLSITPPIARLIKGARQCPTVLWGPLAETRRFNAYVLQSDSRQARGGRKSGIYDIRDESSAMYVCRARIAVVDIGGRDSHERGVAAGRREISGDVLQPGGKKLSVETPSVVEAVPQTTHELVPVKVMSAAVVSAVVVSTPVVTATVVVKGTSVDFQRSRSSGGCPIKPLVAVVVPIIRLAPVVVAGYQ